MKNYDIAVLGGGPGGGAAAAQAEMRGAKTCLIEADRLGGCCLNVGCIPTKAMLHTSDLFRRMNDASEFGLSCAGAEVDGPAFMKRVHEVVATLVKGLNRKYETNRVDLIRGRGRFSGPNRIAVELNDGGREEIEAGSIIIATGSSPIRPDVFPWDSPRVMTTDEAVAGETLPESILIVGGGVIGCEFATLYSELGIPTTLVEMLERLSATIDEDASKLIHRSLRRRKVAVHLRSKIVKVTAGESGVTAETQDGKTIEASRALIAVGRRPNVEGIGLEAAGVKVADGLIPVDDRCRTNIPHVYAVGDVAEKRQYAHLAARMGVVGADNAAGYDTTDDRSVVPVGQFTHPEVASVGLSESEAREAHSSVRAASVQFQATGVGWAYDEREGLVKIIADPDSGRLYGALVVGYRAADVLQELALAMKHGLTVRQIVETIHTHPTFAEVVGFAAEKWIAEAERG